MTLHLFLVFFCSLGWQCCFKYRFFNWVKKQNISWHYSCCQFQLLDTSSVAGPVLPVMFSIKQTDVISARGTGVPEYRPPPGPFYHKRRLQSPLEVWGWDGGQHWEHRGRIQRDQAATCECSTLSNKHILLTQFYFDTRSEVDTEHSRVKTYWARAVIVMLYRDIS